MFLQGRILVLETKPQQQKLHIVSEKEPRGAVYTISGFQVSAARLAAQASSANISHAAHASFSSWSTPELHKLCSLA